MLRFSRPTPATALASVLVMLAAAVLPSGGWASCDCVPGKCGGGKDAGKAKGCCSAPSEASGDDCCAEESVPASRGCCCTSATKTAQHACNTRCAEGQGCECSIAPLGPLPEAPLAPRTVEHGPAFGGLPAYAAPLNLKPNLSPEQILATLLEHPPLPLRELYCVWRK